MSADYHRNGVSGRGFYVGIVKHWGDSGEGEEPRLLQIVALPSEDGTATEDVSKMTFDNGYGVEVYVTDLMVVAKQGTVAFGRNSFRGDNFYAEARAIVLQTSTQWDNQTPALRRGPPRPPAHTRAATQRGREPSRDSGGANVENTKG